MLSLMRRTIITLVATLWAMAGIAQPAPEGWTGGLVGTLTTSPLIGDDTDALALPFIAYRSEDYAIGLNGASYTVFDQNGQEVQLVLRPRFSLIDDDEPQFAGMSRDIGLDLGAQFEFAMRPGFDVSITALQGLTEDQRGQEVDLRFTHQLNGLPVSVYAGAAWQSDGLTEYLYGVRSSEAAAGRPAFSPGAAVTPYIGVSGLLPVTNRAAIIGSIEARQLPGAITDSPIVEDSGTTRATLGIVFNF